MKQKPEDFIGKKHQGNETLSELQQARIVIGAAFVSRTDEYVIVGGKTARSDLRDIVDSILVELLK